MRPVLLRHASILALLPLLLGATAAAAGVPHFIRDSEWVEIRTPQFSVVTNAGSTVGREVGRKLERFSQTLAQVDPALRAHSATPTQVFVFRNQAEIDQYRAPDSERLIAFFARGEDRNLLVVNGSPPDLDRSEVAFHEYVHCYMTMNFPGVPMWLNEGLAEYYSTCRLSSEWADLGRPRMDVVRGMEGRKPLSIETMFAISSRAPAYRRDSDLRIQFYSQSFVLTHWLQSKAAGPERFDRYLDRLREGAEPLGAFQEIYPASEWDRMVRDLVGYTARIGFEPLRRMRLPAPLDADAARERTLSGAEALTRLGELRLLGEHRLEEAEDHFEEALKLDSGFAEAEAALGLIDDLSGDAADAEKRYARAIALAPEDARVWILAGRGTMRRLPKMLMSAAAPETLASIGRIARERYRRALQLAPDHLEALAGPGRIFAILGEPPDSAAVEGLERAVESLPGRNDLAAWLSVVRALQGRTAEAEELMRRRVEPGADRTEFVGAQHALQAAQFNRAVNLANRGRLAEAESLLAGIAERSDDPEVRSRAAQAVVRVQQSKDTGDNVALFEEARGLADAGRFAEARARLVQVRDRTTDAAMRTAAERDIRRLDGELRLRRVAELVEGDRFTEAEALLVSEAAAWPDDAYRARRDQALADVRGRLGIERARTLVRAGKLAEARAAYAHVLALDVSDEMKRHARERIKQLDAATSGR